MILGQRGAKYRHDVLDTGLPAAHSADIALDDDRLVVVDDMVLSPVEAVEVLTLVENRRLGGVEVLGVGLFLVERAAAKRDATPLLVEDREHHAVEEAVDQTAAAAPEGDVGIDHLLRREALGSKITDEHAVARRETEAVLATGLRIELALLAIVAAARVLTAHQQRVVEGAGLLAYLDQAVPLGAGAFEGMVLLKFDAGTVGEVADGLGKAQALALHHVGKGVATLTAAEAVPHLSGGYHMEGRGFLPVKRAASPQVGVTAGPELHGLRHQGHEVRGVPHLVLVILRNHARSLPAMRRTVHVPFQCRG
ncbi:Uncharacterised protein [Collinsella intestinalis]|nr:Uncharacterised protein [Collinsella intestinalis]